MAINAAAENWRVAVPNPGGLGPHRRLSYYARKLDLHISTLHRWRTNGVRGVRLDAVKFGGIWHTSDEDFARFIAAINQPEQVADTGSPDAAKKSLGM